MHNEPPSKGSSRILLMASFSRGLFHDLGGGFGGGSLSRINHILVFDHFEIFREVGSKFFGLLFGIVRIIIVFHI